jgi:hypothetical protein
MTKTPRAPQLISVALLASCLLAVGCAKLQESQEAAQSPGAPSPHPSSSREVQARHPIDGFTLTRPSGFVASGEPANGKIVDGRMAIRIYLNKTTDVEVTVTVHRDGEESAQSLKDYATYEGTVAEVEAAAGSVAMWELTPNDPTAWTSLVAQLSDGSYIWINAIGAKGFDIHYDFLFRMRDAPGSMPPR